MGQETIVGEMHSNNLQAWPIHSMVKTQGEDKFDT
jgi:hypothetical protein